MKKLICILLVLAMAVTMFVACDSGNGEGEATTTTTSKTTTTKRQDDFEPGFDDTPDDKLLLVEGESEWKYHTVEVIWESETSGAMDYLHFVTNGFADFVTANPTWMAPEYDDSEWGSKEAPFGDRILQANADAIGWTGDNHGLFLRTTFEVTQEDIDSLAAGDSTLYAYSWYDNTCYMYLNGTAIFVHDDSSKYQDGVAGDDKSLNVHDWQDAYVIIYFDEMEEHYVYEGDVWDLLVEGENTFAISLLDCWGGREFDLGLSIEYNT